MSGGLWVYLHTQRAMETIFRFPFHGGMCRFELRIEEADFETYGGGGGYMVGGNQF